MSIKKREDGKWELIFRPFGRNGHVVRRTRNTKTECIAAQKEIIAKVQRGENKFTEKKDTRRLSELISEWYDAKGQFLRYNTGRLQKLENMCRKLKDPTAIMLTSEMLTEYRKERIESGSKPNTVNRELDYLRAVFKYLIKTGNWEGQDPVTPIDKIKVPEGSLTYLDKEEQRRLIKACEDSENRHLKLIVLICLSTGARFGEAEKLKRGDVKNSGIQLHSTKSGKRRTIPISEVLFKEILGHEPHSKQRLFSGSYDAFKNAIDNAHIDLPKGQLTHVLRHSFAVSFMESGGNIVVLQKTLGHSSITTTQIYLQYAPDHLEQVLDCNPITKFKLM